MLRVVSTEGRNSQNNVTNSQTPPSQKNDYCLQSSPTELTKYKSWLTPTDHVTCCISPNHYCAVHKAGHCV